MTTTGAINTVDTLEVIQSDLASSMFVEAGAGTGKTYSLVQRIIALLRGGVSIEEIVAITFTRSAASELRSRIRSELEQQRAADPSNGVVKTALEGIDAAAFQTIDSLVYSILREYPLQAGLPPAIEVEDDAAQLREFNENWRIWSLEQLREDEEFTQILSSALRLKMANPLVKMRDLAEAVNRQHGQVMSGEIAPTESIDLSVFDELKAAIDHMRQVGKLCGTPNDNLLIKIRKVEEWIAHATRRKEIETFEDLLDLIVTWPGGLTNGKGGTQSNWGGAEVKAAANSALQDVIDVVKGSLDNARNRVTYRMFEYVRSFVEEEVARRRASGRVSYYDAITWLNEMLENHPDIRNRVQSRFPRLLVDEFQDTDPAQVRLIRLLTIPPTREEGISAGSLFAVGDPKQSIYRFRGAQVEVSQSVKTEMILGNPSGQYLTLQDNRRSTAPVISWVNHVFGMWMTGETDQADWIPLGMSQDTMPPEELGNVYHFGRVEGEGNLDSVRKYDAFQIAHIAQAVCRGEFQIRDRHDGTIRASHAGDLTILMRARSNWETYIAELDKLNLPYSAEIGGAAVLDTQEFRELLNCITAIDDPSDQPATVGALKSIFFGCSDVDLYEWASANGKFTYTSDYPEKDGSVPIASAFDVLRDYHRLKDELRPAVLVERFIRERQARESMFLNRDPAIGLRRLDLAVELTRNFTEQGASSLRECLTRFRETRDSDSMLREEPVLEFDQGKIRMMTMHSSKGLEFPIVLLADLAGSSRSDSPPVLVGSQLSENSKHQIGIHMGGDQRNGYFRCGDYDDLLQANKDADELENTRLLYVASTRARDCLIVSVNRKSGDKKSPAAKIEAALVGSADDIWKQFPFEAEDQPQNDVVEQSSETSDFVVPSQDRNVWMGEHMSVKKEASERSWLSPSSIKEHPSPNSHEKPDDLTPPDDIESPITRGRAATSIGSAVHAAIQRALELRINHALNLRITDVVAIAREEAERHGVSNRMDEVVALTRATIQTPFLRRIWQMRRDDVWIETPVAARMSIANGQSTVIEGRADLIYRLDDGTLGVADFKTDSVRGRTIDEMASPYVPQLGAYGYAVQQTTGLAVSEMSLIFSRLAADPKYKGEYRVDDVNAAIELALELAANRD